MEKVIEALGFHDSWVNLSMECITSMSYSLLINDDY